MVSMAIVITLMTPFVLAAWFFAWWLFDHGAQLPQRSATATAAATVRIRSDRSRSGR